MGRLLQKTSQDSLNFASSIGGAAGGVNQGDSLLRAPLPEGFGVIGVHFPHISFVVIARVRAGPQMDDGGYLG